ncbi:MAG: DUF1015 domain-containing protein, partial [Acidimicrobiaceae bacterium]|nr:DUF1015 domain-containing protein [Acidimicrobiaceae bacterium]
MGSSLLPTRAVPRFEPFPGLRYSLSHVRSLDDVVCPPYDVISDAERLTLLQRSPSNIVRVELPDDEGTGDRYEGAARLLSAWRDGGVLGRDPVPAFYGHRMSFTDDAGQARQSVGVIGALGLEPPGHGVLPHEETTPKAKSDRLQLLRATRVNTSPIWALASAPGLAALCEPPPHPAEHAVDNDHVRHECWPITDPSRIAAISELVGSQPVLIADGHHRYETAVTYQAERGGTTGDHDLVMALVIELSEEHLTVQAIHRLLSGLPAGFDIHGALAEFFDLVPTGPPDRTIASRMDEAGALAVVTMAGTWLGRPRSSALGAAT